jgi:hypothetical protein
MHMVPDGTPDPSPFVYDTTMYAMAALMGCAALSHALVKPVAAKYHEQDPATLLKGVTIVDAELLQSVKQDTAAQKRMLPSMASHMIPSSVLPTHNKQY